MGFYHWVMVAVTGGVGMAATLSLCSLLIWPLHLRSCELWTPPPSLPQTPNLAMSGQPGAETGPMLTNPTPLLQGPPEPSPDIPPGLVSYANELRLCTVYALLFRVPPLLPCLAVGSGGGEGSTPAGMRQLPRPSGIRGPMGLGVPESNSNG